MSNKIFASTSSEITEREIKNAQQAREMAWECMVLLKNEDALPLKKNSAIALYGNGARNTIKGGTGSGDVNTRSFTNIEKGLSEAGYKITTKSWIDRNEAERNACKAAYLAWVEEEGKKEGKNPIFVTFDCPFKEPEIVPITEQDIKESATDTAIFVISRNSGEGADRKNEKGDYQLMENEMANLKLIAERYSKVIVVLNIGGLINMSEISQMKGISAILLMSQLGNLGGVALADVIRGDAVPSGCLSDTWAKDYMDYPSSAEFSFNNGNVHEDYYRDGIYVGYRYFDSFDKDVVYPFGFGLSYTTFEQEVTDVAQNSDKIEVSVKVKNTGNKYPGKSVVQLYVSAPDGKLDKPCQELKGFAKTETLAPGKDTVVKIEVPVASLASYDEETSSWIIEKGDYIIKVGKNSRDTESVATVTFEDAFTTEKCKNIIPLDCELDLIKPAEKAAEKKSADTKWNLSIDSGKLSVKENRYVTVHPEMKTDKKEVLTLDDVKNGKCSLEELVAQLTVEEMATLCVGVFKKDEEYRMVGAASSCVPGAAGETTDLLAVSRKIPKTINADGPAGLRLTPHFKTTKDGDLLPGGEVFGDSVAPFPDNLPSDAVDYYQYCTAIPINWALAQSWNENAVKEIGRMIGSEMELFGVDFWLAPAQNIHRNPLCGRNFEYYSEDPLLTGKISAAITNGVQTFKGRGTTIKHFAANNQEENRYFVNAHIAERTLREIYLKGFEIAVKESQPISVMTSYNLVNGIHTPNWKDLIQSALRDEWGFQGVVMTDWFTSQDVPSMTSKYGARYPISASSGCIYAGNDLQMPGCQKNIDDIVKAVTSGEELDGYKITKGDLQFCAYNLLKVIVKF
ncbi:glycoside hydrolase family 3 protein [Treponema sp.]|uniref:glycoside hydrolase family 3 protein n=1 Tax=Treponema sp. TaxID=166 RepID=UPI00298E23D8|nr:glycoside hydrolase family 3 C-terminal domain-containing protein [Treponema sp.]MCQ2242329.1 glycoside hydrolase family 3 C-terminal domain-containing protein [Treponema sp.]